MNYLHRAQSSFNHFRANTDGNVAMMTAFGGLLIAGMAALAIDSSGVRSAKQELQSHLDVVSLAVATSGIVEREGQLEFAQKFLVANGYDIDSTKLNIQMSADGEVSVTGSVEYANAFSGVWDKDNTTIVAQSSAIAGVGVSEPTDIVLVLDTTGSMQGTKLAALQSSASKLIDVLTEANSDKIQIGVVLFQDL